MKKLLFMAVICLLAFPKQMVAISRIVNVSELEGELTQALRNQIQGLTYNDTVFINFNRVGSDTIKGTITATCNVIMSGLGPCMSTVVLDNGSNQPGFTAFPDDSFFVMRGTLDHTIFVSITDMSFRLKDHSELWWINQAKHAVKIYHAKRVIINQVDSYLKNAACTNFDLRVCSNISVSNCKIVNFNNCSTGGCLWLRGETHNATINNNQFYKYGNDEAVGVFSHLVDAHNGVNGNVSRSNINICNNNFFYGYEGNDKNDLFNNVLFSLYSGSPSSYECSVTDFSFSHNNFYYNDLNRRAITISINPLDSYSNIQFNNNTFMDNYVGSLKRYYRNEIEITDLSTHPDTIFFKNNVFRNDNPVVNPYGDTGASYFMIQGGNICLDGNNMLNTVSTDTAAYTDIGVTLVWYGENGGDVTLRNNSCRNLLQLARVSSGNGISKVKMTASNNSFEGDTRIFCRNIDTLDLVFNKNLFISKTMTFFLQEFASTGSLVFNNNNVITEEPYGKLMAHWNSNPTSSMHFHRLEVQNNILRGISSIENMLKYITNVNDSIVAGNLNLLN
jgi:hypothetical protein